MPRHVPDDGMDKFKRYRAVQQTRGMKLLRVWVPDPSLPGFREEASRQAALLKGAPEQEDTLDFIEANADLGDWT